MPTASLPGCDGPCTLWQAAEADHCHSLHDQRQMSFLLFFLKAFVSGCKEGFHLKIWKLSELKAYDLVCKITMNFVVVFSVLGSFS